jgi:hypothetical protein
MTRLVTHGSPRAAWIARVTNTPNNTYLTSRSTPMPDPRVVCERADRQIWAVRLAVRVDGVGSVDLAVTGEKAGVPVVRVLRVVAGVGDGANAVQQSQSP